MEYPGVALHITNSSLNASFPNYPSSQHDAGVVVTPDMEDGYVERLSWNCVCRRIASPVPVASGVIRNISRQQKL